MRACVGIVFRTQAPPRCALHGARALANGNGRARTAAQIEFSGKDLKNFSN